MKTLLFAFLIAASFLTSLTSCTDEGILHDTDVTVKNDIISTRGNGINRHYFDTGDPNGVPDVDFGCQTPPQSCFDDVVVTGQKLDVVNDIFDNIGSWTSSQLQNYVNTNSDDVEDIIGETETAGIISGTYNLRTRGTELMSTRYLITRSGTTIVSVTPIDN